MNVRRLRSATVAVVAMSAVTAPSAMAGSNYSVSLISCSGTACKTTPLLNRVATPVYVASPVGGQPALATPCFLGLPPVNSGGVKVCADQSVDLSSTSATVVGVGPAAVTSSQGGHAGDATASEGVTIGTTSLTVRRTAGETY